MDKQFILNAQANAQNAIMQLEKAMELAYCADFKEHISKAAFYLEQAAAELRAAEAGKR